MAEVKNDLNRVGLFSELGYISINDPYKKTAHAFNDSAHQGKQMLPGGSKSKNDTMAGYFDRSYARIMTGEGYSDPVKKRRQERMDAQKQNIGKQFVPSYVGKTPSGAGSHIGTFSGTIPALSPVANPKKPYVTPGKNFLTNPSKKGTGYGYVKVTISETPGYVGEPYDHAKEMRKKALEKSASLNKGASFKLNLHPKPFFDANPFKGDKAESAPPERRTGKRELSTVKPFKPSSPGKALGGSKAGCFSSYPTHSKEGYVKQKGTFRDYKQSQKNVFKPSQGPKSMPTKSVMQQNVVKRINVTNFKTANMSAVSV